MTTDEVVAAVADDLYDNLDAACGYVPPPTHDPTLYADDVWLTVADEAHAVYAEGGTLADCPYPPGSRAFMVWGGAFLDLALSTGDESDAEEHP